MAGDSSLPSDFCRAGVSNIQNRLNSDKRCGSQVVLVLNSGRAGVRSALMAVSLLMIVQKIGEKIEELERALDDPRQSTSGYRRDLHRLRSYFDLFVGFDTGTLPAVMLGRLEMTPQTSIKAIEKLRNCHLYRGGSLNNWASGFLRKYYPNLGHMSPEDCEMMPPDKIFRAEMCQTAILTQRGQMAVDVTGTSATEEVHMSRTYDDNMDRGWRQRPSTPRRFHSNANARLSEILAAALTEQGHSGHSPLQQAVDETDRLYNIKASPGGESRHYEGVGLVVSIGCGEDDRTEKMLTTCDIPYIPFDGPEISDCPHDELGSKAWKWIKEETKSYLNKHDINEDITKLAKWLIAYQRSRHGRRPEELFPRRQATELDATPVHAPVAVPGHRQTRHPDMHTSTTDVAGRMGNRANHHLPGSSSRSNDPKQF